VTPVALQIEDDGIACVVLDRADDAVNAINLEFIESLALAIRSAREARPTGLIIVSKKKGQWVAGADLKLIGQAPGREAIEQASRRLQAVFDELSLPSMARRSAAAWSWPWRATIGLRSMTRAWCSVSPR
jgi:enoyl-CoA hydratase/carnithine racemase